MNTKNSINKQYVLENIKSFAYGQENIKSIPLEILEDIEVAKLFIQTYAMSFVDLPAKVKDNEELAFLAVENMSQLLSACSSRLKDNYHLVQLACSKQGNDLQYASKRLRKNKEIVMIALKENPHAYRYVLGELRNDDDIIKLTLYGQGLMLEQMDEKIQHNEIYFKLALERNAAAYRCGTQEMRAKQEFLQYGLKYASNIPYLPEEIKKNKELMKPLIAQDGQVLKYLPDSLRNDKEMCLIALNKTSWAYEGIGEELTIDPELFVLGACHPRSLSIVNRKIFSDPTVFIKAFKMGYTIHHMAEYFEDAQMMQIFKKALKNQDVHCELLRHFNAMHLDVYQKVLPKEIKIIIKEYLSSNGDTKNLSDWIKSYVLKNQLEGELSDKKHQSPKLKI